VLWPIRSFMAEALGWQFDDSAAANRSTT